MNYRKKAGNFTNTKKLKYCRISNVSKKKSKEKFFKLKTNKMETQHFEIYRTEHSKRSSKRKVYSHKRKVFYIKNKDLK